MFHRWPIKGLHGNACRILLGLSAENYILVWAAGSDGMVDGSRHQLTCDVIYTVQSLISSVFSVSQRTDVPSFMRSGYSLLVIISTRRCCGRYQLTVFTADCCVMRSVQTHQYGHGCACVRAYRGWPRTHIKGHGHIILTPLVAPVTRVTMAFCEQRIRDHTWNVLTYS